MKKLDLKLSLSIAAALSLSACATGGTNIGGSQSTVDQYPVETAISNIYTQSRSESLHTTIGNQTASANIRVTPKGKMIFDDKAVQGAQINTVNKINNQVTDQSVAINYYTLNPLTFHGFTDSKGQYSKAMQANTIPKRASVGDSRTLLTEDVYSDRSMQQKVGQYRQSWSLSKNSTNTAWLCIDTSDNLLADAAPEGTTSECHSINKRGDILASKVIINQPTNAGVKRVVFESK